MFQIANRHKGKKRSVYLGTGIQHFLRHSAGHVLDDNPDMHWNIHTRTREMFYYYFHEQNRTRVFQKIGFESELFR